jgi:hypothetical protein
MVLGDLVALQNGVNVDNRAWPAEPLWEAQHMNEKKRQEIALKRFALISPVVNGLNEMQLLTSVLSVNSQLRCPTTGLGSILPKRCASG